MRWCLAAVLLLALGAAPARAAGDRIWSALVLATREDSPPPVPEVLKEFAPAIRKIFGYNSLYLLGEKKRDLYSGGEEWLVPSKEFFFKVQCLAQSPTSYTLRIELYRVKDLLITTEAKLARGAPLFIRGPEWGRGQLIFVLEVR
ncbi:MAG TPA: hypothetical protein VFS35_01905 [Terrimicrobiaceae bacterium]|nr:hypothetical protein [Terrimicrobiaceae bacterium]